MKKILLLILAISLSSQGYTQLWKLRRLELTVGPGTTHFSGDIGGSTGGAFRYSLGDILFRQAGYNFNANVRYRFLQNVAARSNFTFGSFNSVDRSGSLRSLKSSTRFFEAALTGEFYFIKNKGENCYRILRGHPDYRYSFLQMIDLYFYTGLGWVFYDVTPNQTLEALRTNLSGKAPVIPAGIGASVFLSEKWNAGLEIGARYAFSDNLDGYSPSVSSSNDMYYSLNLTITRKIKTVKRTTF